MVKTALSRHFAAKQTLTQTLQLRNVKPAPCGTRAFQLIYTTPDKSGVGSHFGSCSALLLCSFFFVCHFYKIKTEEHGNLHNATLLRRFRFYVGENSRTFQDRIVEFKDFSRIFGNPGLLKDNYKIQELFKTVRTL